MKKHLLSFFVAAVVLIPVSCGKKGPVLPPIKKAPPPVEVQEAFQRGDQVILKWKNPQSYMDGSPLEEISEVEIRRYKKPIKEGDKNTVDLKTFQKQSSVLKSIPSSDFPEFVEDKGQEPLVYVYQSRIEPSDYGSAVYFFGIKARGKKGRESDISNPIPVRPQVVSLPPARLTAHSEADRVKLEWSFPNKNTDGSSPARVKGYNLYRSSEQKPFKRINQSLIQKTHYEDEGIHLGAEYRYFVRSSAVEDPPFLESGKSETIQVRVTDTIPPQVPQALILVAGEDRITLTWDRVRDKDLHGYNVWRRTKGEEDFVLQNPEPIKENIFNDFSVRQGVEYEYCVSAVDHADNESEKSKIISGLLKGCGDENILF